jgi:hypothetical protein
MCVCMSACIDFFFKCACVRVRVRVRECVRLDVYPYVHECMCMYMCRDMYRCIFGAHLSVRARALVHECARDL